MSANRAPTGDWIRELFASIDRMDAGAFVVFLADDAQFRFGNQPPVRGREEIRAAVQAFFSSIKGLAHRIDKTWKNGDSVVCHGEVTYDRQDGASVTVPFADVFYLRSGLVTDYLIFIDVAPLYAESE